MNFQNKIRYIQADIKESLHPVDVFKDWLNEKFKAFLIGFMIFIFGILIGWLLF